MKGGERDGDDTARGRSPRYNDGEKESHSSVVRARAVRLYACVQRAALQCHGREIGHEMP